MRYSICFLAASLLVGPLPSQQIQVEMFPPGPYVSHCKAKDDLDRRGGDDDHHSIFFLEIDPGIADGTSAADFFIHLWDGDNNAQGGSPAPGTQDWDQYGDVGNSPFEYRLYGGPGAADPNHAPPGQDPVTWTGTLLDIDSDAGDDTLRTDDPDDNSGANPEDLRDQDFSLIGVDIDSSPGDLVNGKYIYKFVVDGTFGPGGEWNRYEIQATRDHARTDLTGVRLYTYELTYAGRPTQAGSLTQLAFPVPDVAGGCLDIQTLDLDCQLSQYSPSSTLSTPAVFYDDNQTYETADQFSGGTYFWSSLNQPGVACGGGNGITGMCYPASGQVGSIWALDVDPDGTGNPFSVRFADGSGVLYPLYFTPLTQAYGSGQLNFQATGLPSPGSPSFALEISGGMAGATGQVLVSRQAQEQVLPSGNILYVVLPSVAALPFTLDPDGKSSLTPTIPPGAADRLFYAQAWSDDLAGGFQASNGLAVRILP